MSLLVKLGIDSAEMDRGLAKAETNVGKSMKSIGKSMMRVGGVMTAGLTLPIVAAGVKMISAASDMEESINKVNVVFGEGAGEIQSWAKTAATSMGMSSQQALEAAGTYGNLFQAMGLGLKPATDMSKAIVGLAADMASFNNASPEETLLALRSGLSGEMEPLKKYGVALNEAAMKSMALSMGLGDNILALSEAEKVQIRYAIIVKQTSMAQGDFARTSEGLANTTRIAKAQIADMSATMGAQLLPIALKGVTALSDLVGKFSALTSGQQKTIVITLGVVAAIGPLITITGGLITAIGTITGALTALNVTAGITTGILTAAALPILAVVAAIGLVVAGSQLLGSAMKKNSLAVSDYTDEMMGFRNAQWYVEDATITVTAATDSATQSYTAWALAVENGIVTTASAAGEIEALAEAMEDLGTQYSAVSSLGQIFTKQTEDMDVALQNAKLAQEGYDAALLSGTGIEDATTNLGEAQKAVENLQTAQDLQTAAWMLNCLTQALGVDGITSGEMAFLLQYQIDTGLISADAAIRAQAQWDSAMKMVDGYNTATGAANGITGALNSIPAHVTSTIDISTNQITRWFDIEHGIGRAAGGAFSGWAMVGDTPSGGITPYTEWVYGTGVVYNQAQMAGISAPPMAGGGSFGDIASPSQPILDEAKLARMIRDAILQVVK